MADIGSDAATPSGVETPRPDFVDKRTPGIMHNYFGQVGNNPSQSSPLRNAQVASNPDAEHGMSKQRARNRKEGRRSRGSSASSGSMVMVERDHLRDSTPPPDEPTFEAKQKSPEHTARQLPPTPISSAASVVQRDGEVAENGMPMTDTGLASITQALRNFVLPKSTFGVKARRHQSLPMSSVTKSSVPAAHISNPTSSTHSTRSPSPKISPVPSDKHTTSEHIEEPNRLTSSATAESRVKNTPPYTPRASTTEDRQSGARSPLSNTSASSDNAVPTEKPRQEEATKRQASTRKTSLQPDAPRGKLAVKIAEGRGLKPAVDPYVVCVFEWNEYISQGPRHDKMEVDGDEPKGPLAALQSAPMRRKESDMGKPMAIPMRSRQSSNNGMNDGDRSMDRVTDPQWEHEAVL